MNMRVKRPKCKRCRKPLKRKSDSFIGKKEPYKGNMICYRKKTYPKGQDRYDPNLKVTYIAMPTTYSYTVWDGVSYQYWRGKEFCGTGCAAGWAYDRN